MADNVAITPGSGTTVLADEVVDGTFGTGIVQFVKVMDATADGTNKLIVTGSGAAKVDGSGVTQPVSIATAPIPSVQASGDATLTRATVNITTATDTTIVSATASQTTRLHRFSLSISGACTLTWKSATTTLWAKDFPSAADWSEPFSELAYVETAANEALVLTTSAAVTVKGVVAYKRSA